MKLKNLKKNNEKMYRIWNRVCAFRRSNQTLPPTGSLSSTKIDIIGNQVIWTEKNTDGMKNKLLPRRIQGPDNSK